MVSEVFPQNKLYPLGFRIRGDMILHNGGGARKANSQEMAMWNALVRLDPSIAKPLDG